MQLLDNYLKAVAKGLPADQREDIVRELSEDIRTEMDEKAAELRRPLSEAEQQEILKRHGNPFLLAARYRHDNRSLVIGRELIGPALFPFYVKVLSFNLGLTFVIIGSIFTALIIGGQKVSFGDIVSNALMQLLIQLSVVTLIFALIQSHMCKAPDRWDLGAPRGLHLDLKIDGDVQFSGNKPGRVSRFESISIVVASAVALVWLKEVQLHPFLIFGPAAYFLRLAPIWSQAIPLIAALTFLEMARATVNFVRPEWTRFRLVAQLVIEAARLALVIFMLSARSWVTLADAGSENFRRAASIVNQAFLYGLLLCAMICVVQLVYGMSRLLRAGRKPAPSSRVGVAF
jgi:hypothetical protein